MMKERYMLPLRILVTLLILTMLLPGWGLLSASHLHEESLVGLEGVGIESVGLESVGIEDTVGNLWAVDR
jgi:hypothetical protein